MRWLLIIVGGSLGLVLLAALVVLVPPHVQIRGITPALPDAQALLGLDAGAQGPVAIHLARSSSQDGMSVGHNLVLFEWADGQLFMVDAGMDHQATLEFAELVAMMTPDAGPVRWNGTSPTLLGDRLSNVDGVGFTHLHIDHVQGVIDFCSVRGSGAKAYQTSVQANTHNLHTKEGAGLIADSCLEQVPIDGDGLHALPGFPGLGLVPLGGHTPGSTLFAAKVNGHLWLLAGDIVNAKADLLADRGKGWVYSTLFVPEDTGRTAELRAWLRALDAREDSTVVVAHDAEAALGDGLPLWQ